MNKKSGQVVKELVLPVGNPKSIQGHFRHARLTDKGTILVAHMDMGKVCEYDANGKELFSMNVPGVWSAEPLRNGNFLLTSKNYVREVNRKSETIWDCPLKELSDYSITSPQVSVRLANGNTIINTWHNEWNGDGKVDPANQLVQAIEVTPGKEIVWALRAWSEPADMGPSTIIIPLNEAHTDENVHFGELK